MIEDATQRFSSRVDNYVKYRPGYPADVLELLVEECGLTPASLVADIGAGTGILSELFLKNGNAVYAVEPNREMREAGERLLANYARFTSVDGTAEATTLQPRSMDVITAGQAFHWFDHEAARAEWARILRPGGWVALVWNERRTGGTPFLDGYEQLLRSVGTDYAEVTHRRVRDEQLAAFFAPAPLRIATFESRQLFDFEGLRGRLLSSSYTPQAGHPDHEPMLAALRTLFDEVQQRGQVSFDYDTRVYYGQLPARDGEGETS